MIFKSIFATWRERKKNTFRLKNKFKTGDHWKMRSGNFENICFKSVLHLIESLRTNIFNQKFSPHFPCRLCTIFILTVHIHSVSEFDKAESNDKSRETAWQSDKNAIRFATWCDIAYLMSSWSWTLFKIAALMIHISGKMESRLAQRIHTSV